MIIIGYIRTGLSNESCYYHVDRRKSETRYQVLLFIIKKREIFTQA